MYGRKREREKKHERKEREREREKRVKQVCTSLHWTFKICDIKRHEIFCTKEQKSFVLQVLNLENSL